MSENDPNLVQRIAELEMQVAHLSAYLTVSSTLTQSLGLHDLLETILYCSMEAVSAESASVLLLDDEKKSFHFYQVQGPVKSILTANSFPIDKGMAGCVLREQQSEVVNDVHNDPRFYREIDSRTGFATKNMIVVPLTAGEEKIGILEIINKIGAPGFSQEEHHLLRSIADEIAFAIRNAKLFEYLADLYCRQRQGQNSCKGCTRPLGSWTPCVKYREAEI